MRAKHKMGFLLALVMMCILCSSVVPVWAEPQGTDGTELQVAQPEQLEIQLGAEWAGVEFQMKTDAGLYPDTIPVGQDGVAFLVLVILAALRFILKNKQAIIVWIDRAILFPISYMAAHLCTKGINFMSYSPQRDFCIIVLVAILFYLAMLTGKSLYKAKKEKRCGYE